MRTDLLTTWQDSFLQVNQEPDTAAPGATAGLSSSEVGEPNIPHGITAGQASSGTRRFKSFSVAEDESAYQLPCGCGVLCLAVI